MYPGQRNENYTKKIKMQYKIYYSLQMLYSDYIVDKFLSFT